MVGGEGDDQLWEVPLQGAIVACYGWGGGDDQLWGSARGAIAGCHCRCEENSGVKKSCLELLADVASSSTLIT